MSKAVAHRAIDVELPDAGPYPIPGGGDGPETKDLRLGDASSHEFGIWECAVGEWHEASGDADEIFHVIGGAGRLIDDDGNETELVAGITVRVPPGWSGRWIITERLRKVYAIA